jgi:hypothetical protein
MSCSDLVDSYQIKCDCAQPAWQYESFLITKRWWNHYMWVQGTNLYIVYNYYDSHIYGYKQSGILLRLDGLGML